MKCKCGMKLPAKRSKYKCLTCWRVYTMFQGKLTVDGFATYARMEEMLAEIKRIACSTKINSFDAIDAIEAMFKQ